MAGGSRKRELHVESSWRMVEGENDSFDTSIIHDHDNIVPSSASDPSQFSGSQPFSFGSQPYSISGSQDDNQLQNFLDKAETDDQVILKSPFRPSVPSSIRQSSRENMRHRSPEPEFFMPKVAIESPRRDSGSSSMTQRPPPQLPGLRRRQQGGTRSDRYHETIDGPRDTRSALGDRFAESLRNGVFDTLGWALSVVGLAFGYAKKPLALLLAIYFIFGGLIIAQNMVTKSVYVSLSPLCRIPGASYLDLPFCPDIIPSSNNDKTSDGRPVEFEGLVKVQNQFENVLEKSAEGVSLPMEMKRTEASVRDLRTMVRYSQLQGKDELVLEFDEFIETARTASSDLQTFNTHVGSAVDAVISINRWTSRYLDTIEHEKESRGLISDWTSWVFSPFQPAVFSERILLDKYVEHTSLVSDKILALVDEAQAVLRMLTKADGHLGIIHDFVTRTQKTVQGQKDEILWTLWTVVGGNSRHLSNLNAQLSTLQLVSAQRTTAVNQVTELIVELQKIQAGLDSLRERVREPELVRDKVYVPLSVHIETIDRGVERLDQARSRMREFENERIKEVLARGQGRGGQRLIEA